MLDLLIRLLKALLSSLYFLFEGMPALEALREIFGGGESPWGARGGLLFLLSGVLLLGTLAFLGFLWLFLRRSRAFRAARGRRGPPGRPGLGDL